MRFDCDQTVNGVDVGATDVFLPDESAATPQWIVDDLWAAREAQVLIAATELDVFTQIAAGHVTAPEVARAIGAPERGVRRLLDALVGIEYLSKIDDRYVLQTLAERYLVRGNDNYFGDAVGEMKALWQSWGKLTEVIRTGEPVGRWDDEHTARTEFPKLVSALFPMSLNSARAVVATLGPEFTDRVRSVLDVGAGSGAWSLPFAEASAEAVVTAVDYPEVLPITRGFARRLGLSDRLNSVPGNLREVDFGSGFDVVTLGYIVQTEGPEWGARLIERCVAALRPGGKLVIADMVADNDRAGPGQALVYALDMVLYSGEGDIFTRAEYRNWLHRAGCTDIQFVSVNTPWPLIIATK